MSHQYRYNTTGNYFKIENKILIFFTDTLFHSWSCLWACSDYQ